MEQIQHRDRVLNVADHNRKHTVFQKGKTVKPTPVFLAGIQTLRLTLSFYHDIIDTHLFQFVSLDYLQTPK